MRLKTYFSLNDIVLLTLLAALVFALRVYLRIPMHLPGKSSAFWVFPIIVGIGITGKPGSGTFMGILSGVLAAMFGMGDSGVFELLTYLAMGVAVDVGCLIFRNSLGSLLVGAIVGASSSLFKMVVNYSIDAALGIPAAYILAGIGVAAVIHSVSGGIGGAASSLVLDRLYKSGVVRKHGK